MNSHKPLIANTCLEKALIGREFGSSCRIGMRGNRAGRNDMKRFYASLVYPSLVYASLVYASLAIVAAFGGWASLMPANAAPPTVTPSPGYDARLQEQRAARTTYEPVTRPLKPVSRRHVKRTHDGAH
jgi:hypothetical protein